MSAIRGYLFPHGCAVRQALALLLLTLMTGLAPGGGALAADQASEFPVVPARSLFKLESSVVPDGRTVPYLGESRSGSGVMLDPYTVLTIGYLLLEADQVDLTSSSGRTIPASVAAYDHATGFGLVRSPLPLDGDPIRFGDAESIVPSEYLLAM